MKQPVSSPVSEQVFPRLVRVLLVVLVLAYALIAGLRTTVDFDLGWQMAIGRYLLEHHAVPRTDLFSYTIAGAPWRSWNYPALGCLLLERLFHAGGYAAISWLCALVTVACALLLAARRGAVASLLVLLAVPVLASETMPRASLFTMLLVALMGRLLLEHARGRRAALWLLPVLMLLWANLHPGFIAGYALMGAYLLYEGEQSLQAEHRVAAAARLRRAVPWLAVAAVAVVVNPFGLRVFDVVAQQRRAVAWQTRLLLEWQPAKLQGLGHQLLSLRQPESAVWWLLVLSLPLAAALLWRRYFVAVAVLGVAWTAFLLHRRMEGPAVLIVCLVGGEALCALEQRLAAPSWLRRGLLPSLALALVALVALRCFDVVTYRAPLAAGEITRYGAGRSWWIPASAVDALERLHPADATGNVFAPFDLGSYLLWRGHAVFADGRAVPFGPEILEEQRRLSATPLDAPAWAAAAERYHLDAAVFPLSRLLALGEMPLAADCMSRSWAPVYMDTTGIVFLRRTSANAAAIARSTVDCRSIDLLEPLAGSIGPGLPRSTGIDTYQQAANAVAIYAALGRLDAASDALRLASGLSSIEDPSLLFARAQVAVAMGSPLAAEQLLRGAVKATPSDAAWYNLALVLASQQRYREGADALAQAAALSQEPWQRDLVAGQMLVAGRDGDAALGALNNAVSSSPFGSSQEPDAREFRAAVATTRAQAYVVMQRLPQAVAQQRLAVAETPDSAARADLLTKLCSLRADLCPAH